MTSSDCAQSCDMSKIRAHGKILIETLKKKKREINKSIHEFHLRVVYEWILLLAKAN